MAVLNDGIDETKIVWKNPEDPEFMRENKDKGDPAKDDYDVYEKKRVGIPIGRIEVMAFAPGTGSG
jgi:hypothetical protein